MMIANHQHQCTIDFLWYAEVNCNVFIKFAIMPEMTLNILHGLNYNEIVRLKW